MIEIARLEAHEWEVYRDVRLAALADAPLAFGSRFEVERDRTDDEWRGRLAARTQFVAREAGMPVGTVGCRAEEEGIVELVSMWVAPSARGSGVADLLVVAVMEEARAQGSETIIAWVSNGNDRAERLYARHGFERTGRVQPIDDDLPERGEEFQMRMIGLSRDNFSTGLEP